MALLGSLDLWELIEDGYILNQNQQKQRHLE
jgi:hypothetical protein